MKENQQHYTNIAARYNDFLLFSDSYKAWATDLIIKSLSLRPDDIVADIGGGTGTASHSIFKRAGLKNDVLCTDPSNSMIAQAGRLEGVKPLCMDAHEFAENTSEKYDKLLLKEMVHHLTDRVSLWNKLRGRMNKNGSLLIVTRPQIPSLPFFKAALDSFSAGQPTSELLAAELGEAGFRTEVAVHSYSVRFEKERWYYLLQNRFMSNLHDFTEDEIKEGIAELEQTYSDEKRVEVRDDLLFILGTASK